MGTGIIRGTIGSVWNGVKNFFGVSSDEVSRDIGTSDSFELEKANTRKIEKMNEELLEYSKKYSQKSNELEQNVFDQINDTLDKILDSMAEIENVRIDGKKVRINLNSLKKEMRRFERSKRGKFMSAIYKALSLDNKECLEILKLDSGIEKEKNMKKFLNKILNEELKSLGTLVSDVLEENLMMLAEVLEDKIIELEESINEEIQSFKKLESSREIGIKERDILLRSKIKEKIMYMGIINESI